MYDALTKPWQRFAGVQISARLEGAALGIRLGNGVGNSGSVEGGAAVGLSVGHPPQNPFCNATPRSRGPTQASN